MLYKHSFSILCGHLSLNQKRKKNWIWPVTSQTGRLTGQTDRYIGTNRLHCKIWIQNWFRPVPIGFQPNRSGIPVPDPASLAGSVGKRNPRWDKESMGKDKTCSLGKIEELLLGLACREFLGRENKVASTPREIHAVFTPQKKRCSIYYYLLYL